MPVQMIGLEEVTMLEVSDDVLEKSSGLVGGSQWSSPETYGCVTCD